MNLLNSIGETPAQPSSLAPLVRGLVGIGRALLDMRRVEMELTWFLSSLFRLPLNLSPPVLYRTVFIDIVVF